MKSPATWKRYRSQLFDAPVLPDTLKVSKNVFSKACHLILQAIGKRPPLFKSQHISLKNKHPLNTQLK